MCCLLLILFLMKRLPPGSTRTDTLFPDTTLFRSGSDQADLPADDPAYLIGLALSHIRRGKGLTGIVPDTITDRLQSHADKGNPACRLLLDWLVGRHRDLPGLSQPDPARLHSIETRPGRRMIRAPPHAGPGSLKTSMDMKAQ